MQIEDSYKLYGCSINNGNKDVSVYSWENLPPSFVYTNLKTGKIKGNVITIERYYKFLDKYRGKKQCGYNQPEIVHQVIEKI